MPTNVFKAPSSDNDCLNYIRPSSKTERFTSFATARTVTLSNPQRVINNQSADAVIALQLRGDATYTPYGLPGYGQITCDAVSIGSTGDGTTSTDVIVNGID